MCLLFYTSEKLFLLPNFAAGAESNETLPPPPWEVQQSDISPVTGAQQVQLMQGTQVPVPMQSSMQSPGLQPMMNNQLPGMYMHPITAGQQPAVNNHAFHGNQVVGLHPQQVQGMQYGMFPQQYQVGQMTPMYPQQMYGNQMAAYGYGQQPGAQFLEQRMSGLSMRDDNSLKSSSTSSYLPPMKPSKSDDKLFGDLVDISKFKPSKPTPGRAGSM